MRAWDEEQVASARALAEKYTTKYPANVWGWVVLADLLGQIAHYDDAKRALTKALALAPPEVLGHVYARWGHFYRQKQELAAAKRWYQKAVAEEVDTSHLVFLGAVLAKQGRFAEAKRCHRRAIKVQTCSPDEAYYNLGLILRAEKRFADAHDAFSAAIKLDPQYAIAKAARDDVRKMLKRH